jgi:hypothetical protein
MSNFIAIDLEFMESPGSLEILSIGMVNQHGNMFYGVSLDADYRKANPWVKEHVLPNLASKVDVVHYYRLPELRQAVLAFVGPERPEFWGDCAAFDFVAMCWLFGGMNADTGGQWPSNWPYYFNDIQAKADEMGVELLQESSDHHALSDAVLILANYNHLMNIQNTRLARLLPAALQEDFRSVHLLNEVEYEPA